METHDGEPISTPEDLVGINVRAQGSNLDFGLYVSLFRAIAAELWVSGRYFAETHEYSNINDAARYVRVLRDCPGCIYAADGILARIANVLGNDREGYRKCVADDRDEPGKYHSATIGSKRAAELVDGHRLAKEIKHYLPRDTGFRDPDDPLYHPKVEVSFQRSKNDDGTIPWSELADLDREFDETLVNVLRWSGLLVADDDRDRPGGPGGESIEDVYVPDQYFDVETDHRNLTLTPDPTPALETRQESVIIKLLSDGLGNSEKAIVGQLLADGGHHSPDRLADETGRHISTIYRAIKRVPELIEHEYGNVALRSPYIAEQLIDAVERAENTLTTTLQVSANALAFAAEDLESSALVKWLRAHIADLLDGSDGLTIRIGNAPCPSIEDLRAALRKGYRRWVNAGRDPARFRSATVKTPVNAYSPA